MTNKANKILQRAFRFLTKSTQSSPWTISPKELPNSEDYGDFLLTAAPVDNLFDLWLEETTKDETPLPY